MVICYGSLSKVIQTLKCNMETTAVEETTIYHLRLNSNNASDFSKITSGVSPIPNTLKLHRITQKPIHGRYLLSVKTTGNDAKQHATMLPAALPLFSLSQYCPRGELSNSNWKKLKKKQNLRRNYQNIKQEEILLYQFNPIPILYNWSNLVVITLTMTKLSITNSSTT